MQVQIPDPNKTELQVQGFYPSTSVFEAGVSWVPCGAGSWTKASTLPTHKLRNVTLSIARRRIILFTYLGNYLDTYSVKTFTYVPDTYRYLSS